jgi:4-hydroxybenzoate polyprenyltransferase
MLVVLAWFGIAAGLGIYFHASLVLVAGAVVYEHRSAARRDIEGVNQAFFWSNAFVGAVFVAGVAAEIWGGR